METDMYFKYNAGSRNVLWYLSVLLALDAGWTQSCKQKCEETWPHVERTSYHIEALRSNLGSTEHICVCCFVRHFQISRPLIQFDLSGKTVCRGPRWFKNSITGGYVCKEFLFGAYLELKNLDESLGGPWRCKNIQGMSSKELYLSVPDKTTAKVLSIPTSAAFAIILMLTSIILIFLLFKGLKLWETRMKTRYLNSRTSISYSGIKMAFKPNARSYWNGKSQENKTDSPLIGSNEFSSDRTGGSRFTSTPISWRTPSSFTSGVNTAI